MGKKKKKTKPGNTQGLANATYLEEGQRRYCLKCDKKNNRDEGVPSLAEDYIHRAPKEKGIHNQ